MSLLGESNDRREFDSTKQSLDVSTIRQRIASEELLRFTAQFLAITVKE
jgi:hypothetical protein